jgi:hypothetical protein
MGNPRGPWKGNAAFLKRRQPLHPPMIFISSRFLPRLPNARRKVSPVRRFRSVFVVRPSLCYHINN